MSAQTLPLAVQIIIAVLLLISAGFTVLGALGLLRFDDFYLRMHPTAIVFTVGAWCVCIAVMLFFSFTEGKPALYALLLIPLIIITMPITTAIVARAVLFRWRNAAHPAPPALSEDIITKNPIYIPSNIQSVELQQPENIEKKDPLSK